MTGNLKISGNSVVDVDIGDVTASGITDSEAAGILTSWDTDQAFLVLEIMEMIGKMWLLQMNSLPIIYGSRFQAT